MARPASPIDITPPTRYNSSSPRNQTSNLTFALQEAGAHDYQPTDISVANPAANDTGRLSVGGHRDSISNGYGSYYGAGARPIAMKDRPRRESNTGSFVNGMSWGGVSVGSWIRDDIMMAGTSPAAFNQSPSFHSSSYLPKMEANFMRDFTCCNLTLDSLHDLLQHFEEAHAQGPQQSQRNPSIGGGPSTGRPGSTSAMIPTSHPSSGQADPASNTQHGFRTSQGTPAPFRQQRRESFNKTNLSTVQDMDTLEDMEMDDVNPLPPIGEQESFSPQQQQQQTQFGQGSGQIPQLNINVTSALGNQMRNSTPNTPLATTQSFGFQNNPTVSSVNTPTLGTQPLQQQQRTPDSSVPGTPAELDPDFSMNFNGLNMPLNSQTMQDGSMNFNLGFGGLGGFDGTIDQPAKRLFSKNGPSGLTQAQLALALRQNQAGTDSELAKRLREQAILANAAGIPFPEENKPFRCPVIGCEKAYKNQNGLKYHKQHGHQNQQLKENEDGTFSIVDPVTSIPYPGTVGMEKEKPYRCEVCGKRYKNLNGLKYHRQHSAPCNPELKLGNLNLNNLQSLQGLNMNANVAGAGLAGMSDTNMNF